jgi:hypothetical protein
MKIFYKTYYFVFLFAVIGIFATDSYAQDVKYKIRYDTLKTIKTDTIKTVRMRVIKVVTVRSVPKFILQLSGFYNSGAMELQGHNGGFSKNDFLTGKNFGARNGFGTSLTGKLPLHKQGHFWLDFTAGFNRFQSNLVIDNTKEGKVYYNIFYGGTGIDYIFTPAHRVKYFLGANAVASVINGNAELYFEKTSRYAKSKKVIDIKSSFRIGYAIYFGFEYAFEKNFGMNIGLKFTHANLLLKQSDQVTDTTQTSINDGSTDPPVLFGGWKQFAYTSVFAGVSYYFGVKEKSYRLP